MRFGEALRNPLFLRFSLRTNLLVLLALLSLFVVVDRTREILATRDAEIARARTEILSLARDGAGRQSDLISEARVTLRLAAAIPELAGTSLIGCQVPFRRIVGDRPWLASMAVIRLDGELLCTSADKFAMPNLADREYFRQALATRGFVVSDYIISRMTQKPAIIAAMPRIVRGTMESVLTAVIDVHGLNRLAAETGQHSDAEVMLLDSKGTVVAASPNAESWVGQSVSRRAPDFWRLLAAPDGIFESAGIDGEESIVAHVALPDTRGVLVVTRARSDVLAVANQQASTAVVKILLFGLLCLVLVWLGGEWFVLRPLDALTRSAASLGLGDLSTRVSMKGLSPEFRLLADTFNTMAAQLAEHEGDLRKVNARLAELAATDGLTGLANRRHFDELVDIEWRRACRSGGTIALLMIDVDRFKNYNDRYGHVAGDECLRRVGEVLRKAGRRVGDLAARTGGEEFAVLLPGADSDDASTIAESVRHAIEALGIEHLDSADGHVTASIGIAAFRPRPGQDVRSLLNAADAALYRAKRAGRNRVVLDQTPVALAS